MIVITFWAWIDELAVEWLESMWSNKSRTFKWVSL